jgi:hypothetical protein
MGGVLIATVLYQLIVWKYPWKNSVEDGMNLLSTWTFISAVFIGYFELREEFYESLPRLMSVQFYLKEMLIYECKHAVLAHEGDIRQWAQQIGKQMNHDEDLPLDPLFFVSTDEKPKQFDGKLYKHYTVRYNLKNNSVKGTARGQINPEEFDLAMAGKPKKRDLMLGDSPQ